jgi:hypothetical protein
MDSPDDIWVKRLARIEGGEVVEYTFVPDRWDAILLMVAERGDVPVKRHRSGCWVFRRVLPDTAPKSAVPFRMRV